MIHYDVPVFEHRCLLDLFSKLYNVYVSCVDLNGVQSGPGSDIWTVLLFWIWICFMISDSEWIDGIANMRSVIYYRLQISDMGCCVCWSMITCLVLGQIQMDCHFIWIEAVRWHYTVPRCFCSFLSRVHVVPVCFHSQGVTLQHFVTPFSIWDTLGLHKEDIPIRSSKIIRQEHISTGKMLMHVCWAKQLSAQQIWLANPVLLEKGKESIKVEVWVNGCYGSYI